MKEWHKRVDEIENLCRSEMFNKHKPWALSALMKVDDEVEAIFEEIKADLQARTGILRAILRFMDTKRNITEQLTSSDAQLLENSCMLKSTWYTTSILNIINVDLAIAIAVIL